MRGRFTQEQPAQRSGPGMGPSKPQFGGGGGMPERNPAPQMSGPSKPQFGGGGGMADRQAAP